MPEGERRGENMTDEVLSLVVEWLKSRDPNSPDVSCRPDDLVIHSIEWNQGFIECARQARSLIRDLVNTRRP